MGIHDAPPDYSEEAFEAKWKTLVDSIMAPSLPVVKNFISFDAVRLDRNSLLRLYPYLTTDIPKQSCKRAVEGPRFQTRQTDCLDRTRD
jgi:hypothetical protein